MKREQNAAGALVLGVFLCGGLIALGMIVSTGIMKVRALERTVSVKGLSEREVAADVAIWPIKFSDVDNDLNALFASIQEKNGRIGNFLKANGFKDDEISVSVPAIVDRQAQGYSEAERIPFRYTGSSTITVYSLNVQAVRKTMDRMLELGKQGIAIVGQDYQTKTEFLFTNLNDVKPDMIEEATRNARYAAEKFAEDSDSKLGKIKRASQGQFTISDRDSNTPYIKKIRVVSTVEFYLSD